MADDTSNPLASFEDESIRTLAYGEPADNEYVQELLRRGLEPIPYVTRDVDRVDIAAMPADIDPTRFGSDELGIDADGNPTVVPYSERPFAQILIEARAGDEQAGEELVLRNPFTYTKDGQLTATGKATAEKFGLPH